MVVKIPVNIGYFWIKQDSGLDWQKSQKYEEYESVYSYHPKFLYKFHMEHNLLVKLVIK